MNIPIRSLILGLFGVFLLLDFFERVLPTTGELSDRIATVDDGLAATANERIDDAALLSFYGEYTFSKRKKTAEQQAQNTPAPAPAKPAIVDPWNDRGLLLGQNKYKLVGTFLDEQPFAIVNQFGLTDGDMQVIKITHGQQIQGYTVKEIDVSRVVFESQSDGASKELRMFERNT